VLASALFKRLRISTTIAYILTGFLLGGQVLGVIKNEWLFSTLGEIGMLLILFYLGLQLNPSHLRKTGKPAVLLALLEFAVLFAVLFAVCSLFGFKLMEAVLIASFFVVSSSVEAAKLFFEKKIWDSREGDLAETVLFVEDLITVAPLILAASIARGTPLVQSFGVGIAYSVAVLLVVRLGAGAALRAFGKLEEEHKMLFFALGVGFVSAIAGEFLGVPAFLGAYFAGIALAETRYAKRIKREVALPKEFFLLFFFAAFGASVMLPESAGILAVAVGLTAAYIVLKLFVFRRLGPVVGVDAKIAGAVGKMLLPVSEFGVVLVVLLQKNLAASAAVVNVNALLEIAFTAIIITTLLAPFFFREKEFEKFEKFEKTAGAAGGGASKKGLKIGFP
jgi:Kef-type K+ transport system membrane component KefB